MTGDEGTTVAADPVAANRAARRARRLSNRQWGRRLNQWFLPLIAIVMLVTLVAGLALWERVIRQVDSGAAGVLYRRFGGGTVTDRVFGEGVHVLWPWNRLAIYNTRVQTVLHTLEVLTNKGLPIHLRLAIRYHPEKEMVGLLHKSVGPDYVQTIVVPQVESVLRREIGKQNPEDIYTNKEGVLTDIILTAIEEAGPKFVFIDDIIIRTVRLPPFNA